MTRAPNSIACLLAAAGAVLTIAAGCGRAKKTTSVPASLSLQPSAVVFKTVAVGASATLSLALRAQTASSVTVQSATLTDQGDGARSAFSLGPVPTEVPGSGAASLEVTFAPTQVARYAATLVITSNDGEQPTQTVSLSGVGASPHLEVGLDAPADATARLTVDGGLSVTFVEPPGGASGIAWPEVLLQNTGGVGAQLTGFSFARGDAGFYLPTVPTVPQAIAPEQTRAIQVAFSPPPGNGTPHPTDTLILTFDDPALPQATVALAADVHVNQPPLACAYVVSAQELDGTLNASDGGGAPPVEPGARLQLSAFASDVGAMGDCSSDPEDGANLTFSWTVASAPPGSRAALSSPGGPRPTFVPDLPGPYDLRLAVTDSAGATARADQVFTAAPLEDLTVRLAWPNQPHIDLDLHLVRPGGVPFASPDDVSSLTPDAGHDWGAAGDPTDDPHFSGDDIGDGALTESVWLNRPEHGCLGDGGCAYAVWVHYFQDHRAVDGGSCPDPVCLEGAACGCTGAGAVCEPGRSCTVAARPQVQVFLKGQTAPALTVPPSAAPILPSPCFMWHALDVRWRPDGGVEALAVPGDGGAVEYWGNHTDQGTLECRAGPGGYSPTSPPAL